MSFDCDRAVRNQRRFIIIIFLFFFMVSRKRHVTVSHSEAGEYIIHMLRCVLCPHYPVSPPTSVGSSL